LLASFGGSAVEAQLVLLCSLRCEQPQSGFEGGGVLAPGDDTTPLALFAAADQVVVE